MAVSHSPAGYTGTVDEIAETKRFGLMGPTFRVNSVNDWAPSADAGVNRQVNVAAGTGAAFGVADTTTATDSVTFAANNGTTNRYDALVASFCWAANSGLGLAAHSVTFRVITGTTTPPAVNGTTTVDNTKINRVRGVQYDALLAVVRVRPSVGLFTSGDVVDCRTWGGYGGYTNCGSGQYLTLLDTFPGALVHDVSTDIVWNRLAGGVWGFEKWIGTDRTKQPMLSLRNTIGSITNNASTLWISWPDITDHSGGLLSYVGNAQIQCNVPGRIRIDAMCLSDSSDAGYSLLEVSLPAGGGNYTPDLQDLSQRSTGYAGAGQLRQSVNAGPVQVQAGDLIEMTVLQLNASSSTLAYQGWLTVTYV